MTGLQQTPVEMSFSLPAAVLCPVDSNQRRLLPASLRVERSREALCLTPQGDWCAEMILEGLPKALAVPSSCPCLEIDLGLLAWLDDLDLSALIVVIRGQASNYSRIELTGLPTWAGARLHLTGVERLLGAEWGAELTLDKAVFRR